MRKEYAERFATWLEENRYSPGTIQSYGQVLAQFEEYLRTQGITEVTDLRPHHIERFVRAKRRAYHKAFSRPPSPAYLHVFRSVPERFLKLLREWGIAIPLPKCPAVEKPFAKPQEAYLADLRRKGHLQESTLQTRLEWITRFCEFLNDREVGAFREVSPAVLYDFLTAIADGKAATTLRGLMAALRDFLTFAFDHQLIDKDLSLYLPRVRHYRDQKLPHYLSHGQLEDLLARIDVHQPGARKLKAILLLLASYGLRIGEVAALTFEDLDWAKGELLLAERKNGEPLLLPLTPEVRIALVNYLRHERLENIDSPYVFLTTQRPAPYRDANSLAHAVNAQLRRLGVKATTRTFRHSFAKELLDQRVPLHTIQELLGHRSIDSTRHYARLDVEALREVAHNDSLNL